MFKIDIRELLGSETNNEAKEAIEFLNEKKATVARVIAKYDEIIIPHLRTVRGNFGEDAYRAFSARVDKFQDFVHELNTEIDSALAAAETLNESLANNGSEEIAEDIEELVNTINKELESIEEKQASFNSPEVKALFDRQAFKNN